MGMFNVVRNQFPELLPEAIFELIRNQIDYSADKQEPKPGPYFKDAKLTGGEYLTRLEDIDASWVEAYLEDRIIGIRTNTKENTLYEYNKNTRVKYFFADEETGELSDPSEYDIEERDYTEADLFKWREKLPYILKRLHERSKAVRVHLMSFVIAYEKALKVSVNQRSKRSSVSPSLILSMSVYEMNPNGTIGPLIRENKHKGLEYLKWIRGEGEHDEYLENVIELTYICNRLGIELSEENPFDYQENFINSLVVTYVSSNKEVGKRINREVLDGLRTVSLRDFNKIRNTRYAKVTWDSMACLKASHFLCTLAEDITLFRDTRNVDVEMRVLVSQLSMLAGEDVKILKTYPVRDGFYMTPSNEYLLVDVRSICRVLSENGEPLRAYKAIVHSSGFLVLVTGQLSMHYLDYKKALEYIQDAFTGRVSENKRYSNNTKFGTWEEARI